MIRAYRFVLVAVALLCAARAEAANAGDVIISEINWAGSTANTGDEWVELFNTTGSAIDMTGWHLYETNGGTTLTNQTAGFPLPSGTIPANGFMLITARSGAAVASACTNATTCTKISITAFNSNLANGGEQLQLQDNTGKPIDTAGNANTAWPAGSNGTPKKSMERNSPLCGLPDGTLAASWHSNDGTVTVGTDSGGNSLTATPGAANSQWSAAPLCSTALSGSLVAADGVDTIVVTAVVGGSPDSVAVNIRAVGGSYAAQAMTLVSGATYTFSWTSTTPGPFEYYVSVTKGAVTLPAAPPALPDFVGFYDTTPACIGPVRSVDANGAITNDTVAVLVGGMVITPNPAFNTFTPATSGNQFYVQDSCAPVAAISVFTGNNTTRFPSSPGDSVVVLGRLTQFDGLTEITAKATHTYSSGGTPVPALMTLAQIAAAPPELLEGQLVEVRNLTITAGAWPAAASDGTLTVTDDGGTTTFTLFVDKDTDVDGTAAPGSAIRIVTILSQLDTASPLLDSYELIPRTSVDVNAAPVITGPGDQSVNENALLTFTTTATDRESDTITWSATGLPAGASYDVSTQIFSWTPSFTQAGSYAVTFKAADAYGATSKVINITVGNTNRAPVMNALSDQNGTEEQLLTFTVSATDPDGDVLAYSMSSAPTGATLDAATGVFSWTPALGQAGSYMVTFTATDPGTLSDSKQITLNIAAEPRDLSTPPDMTVIPDMTVLPDLSVPPDLSTPSDLSISGDMTKLPDLTPPPDLSLADMSAPDDLTTSADLSGADLSNEPDLSRAPNDLGTSPDLATGKMPKGGCNCQVADRAQTSPLGTALLAVAFALVVARRRFAKWLRLS
jgi:MYXO-CTERM domain-containing protein